MTENNKPNKKVGFIRRQLNTIVACAVVFAVLLTGYLLVKNLLLDGETPTTTTPPVELFPGEVMKSNTTLLYPALTEKDLKEIRIHNPDNAARGEEYVDWGITFAFLEEVGEYYGYITGQEKLPIDENQLAYFTAVVTNPVFAARLVDHHSDDDLSLYGFAATKEESRYVEVEKKDGTVYTLYFGKKNPSGNGYYVRSGDTVKQEDGSLYQRDSIYLMGSTTTSYYDKTVMALPTEMASKVITYPVSKDAPFASFAIRSLDGSIDVAFEPLRKTVNGIPQGISKVEHIFGGSCVYYGIRPDGYFSSPAFETRIRRFEDFQGLEVMEYATKLVKGEDENGKEIIDHEFDNDVLAEYGLDSAHMQYMMTYTALCDDFGVEMDSAVIFSKLRSDGYYYAYSLNFGTILRVDPNVVDFLGWKTLDFVDSYAFRMNIGYIDELTVKGKINSVPFQETFKSTVDDDFIVKKAHALGAKKEVDLLYYKELFREIYSTMLWDEAPLTDEEKAELMKTEPYFEMNVKTYSIGVSVAIAKRLPSVNRVLRFYKFSNGRALMTMEMYDANGTLIEESGKFFVRVSRLDKLIVDAQKLVNGEHFSYYDKES